jgi:hypothetical protein
LKPSFIGGFRGTQEWISLAEKHHIVVDVVWGNRKCLLIVLLQHNLMPQGLVQTGY